MVFVLVCCDGSCGIGESSCIYGLQGSVNFVCCNWQDMTVIIVVNKISTGQESAQCVDDLRSRMKEIGYNVVTAKGNAK